MNNTLLEELKYKIGFEKQRKLQIKKLITDKLFIFEPNSNLEYNQSDKYMYESTLLKLTLLKQKITHYNSVSNELIKTQELYFKTLISKLKKITFINNLISKNIKKKEKVNNKLIEQRKFLTLLKSYIINPCIKTIFPIEEKLFDVNSEYYVLQKLIINTKKIVDDLKLSYEKLVNKYNLIIKQRNLKLNQLKVMDFFQFEIKNLNHISDLDLNNANNDEVKENSDDLNIDELNDINFIDNDQLNIQLKPKYQNSFKKNLGCFTSKHKDKIQVFNKRTKSFDDFYIKNIKNNLKVINLGNGRRSSLIEENFFKSNKSVKLIYESKDIEKNKYVNSEVEKKIDNNIDQKHVLHLDKNKFLHTRLLNKSNKLDRLIKEAKERLVNSNELYKKVKESYLRTQSRKNNGVNDYK